MVLQQLVARPPPVLRTGARLWPRFGLALQKPSVSGVPRQARDCFPPRENRRVLPTPL